MHHSSGSAMTVCDPGVSHDGGTTYVPGARLYKLSPPTADGKLTVKQAAQAASDNIESVLND